MVHWQKVKVAVVYQPELFLRSWWQTWPFVSLTYSAAEVQILKEVEEMQLVPRKQQFWPCFLAFSEEMWECTEGS